MAITTPAGAPVIRGEALTARANDLDDRARKLAKRAKDIEDSAGVLRGPDGLRAVETEVRDLRTQAEEYARTAGCARSARGVLMLRAKRGDADAQQVVDTTSSEALNRSVIEILGRRTETARLRTSGLQGQ